jgi:hypothetical protein
MTPEGSDRSAAPLVSRVVAVLWAGFLSACLATMLFFAGFDPQQLFDADPWPRWLTDRRSGYALGFFFFWMICTLAGALSAWLLTPGAEQRHS